MSAIPSWAAGLKWIECAETDAAHGPLDRARLNGPPVCVVQTRDGDVYTVGEINGEGGRCNCCGALTYDPVVRYAFVVPHGVKP